MAKLSISISVVVSALAIIGTLGVATLHAPEAQAAPDACKRTEFKTKLVKDACATGGQKGAKDAMKAWMKTAKPKFKGCPDCHSNMAPSYALKPGALDKFVASGGVLQTATPAKPAAKPTK